MTKLIRTMENEILNVQEVLFIGCGWPNYENDSYDNIYFLEEDQELSLEVIAFTKEYTKSKWDYYTLTYINVKFRHSKSSIEEFEAFLEHDNGEFMDWQLSTLKESRENILSNYEKLLHKYNFIKLGDFVVNLDKVASICLDEECIERTNDTVLHISWLCEDIPELHILVNKYKGKQMLDIITEEHALPCFIGIEGFDIDNEEHVNAI